MNPTLDLDELTRSTRRREFEDGLVDFMNAGVFLVVSLLLASVYSAACMRTAIHLAINHPDLMLVTLVALAPVMAILLIVSNKLIERTRRRKFWKAHGIVHPLRGYIDWRINAIAAITVVILTFIGMWGTLLGDFAPGTDLRTFAGSVGIATGIVYLGMGQAIRLPRYKTVGFVGGMLSAVIPFLPISMSSSWAALGAIWTLMLVASGVVGLRHTRPASGEVAGV